MESKLNLLEKVDLRHVWTSESGDFTPWLAQEENLKLLGDTISVDLELVAQEKAVGLFYADIVCVNTLDETKVLIENQLERTDHTHLGQLLTYAAGLDAVTIIWIAKHITDEHRAALDWLNSITGEGFNFFGLEIELWQIGDSDVAPKFNIVSKPNEWTRIIRITEEMTPDKQLQLDFWTAFKVLIDGQESITTGHIPKPRRSMRMDVGWSRVNLIGIASFWDSEANSYSSNELRAEVYLRGSGAKNRFSVLQESKEEMENELGEPLIWSNPSDSKICRIYFRKTVDLRNRDSWPEQHAWLLEKLQELRRVFTPIIREL